MLKASTKFSWLMNSIVAVSLSLSACSNHDDKTTPEDAQVKTFGGAQFSSVTLANGIRVLVSSVPGRKNAIVSVSVAAGSYHEPTHQPGLAHFVEHVLFLGNKENPGPTEYMNFINDKNGRHNAHTGTEFTSYFVQMNPQDFSETVHRLSRFFVAPLFDDKLVANEKAIIHNEYSLRVDSDQTYRAMGAYYPSGANTRRFSVGNSPSLASVTTTDAKSFFEQYYAPHKMTVILYGPQSIDELKALAIKNFADVPKRKGAPELTESELSNDKLGTVVKVTNEKLNNGLDLTFIAENQKASIASKQVIASVLGDEGPGSLLSVLQARGLALPARGALLGGVNGNRLHVNIKLTPEGVKKYTEVIQLTKSYIEFMKSTPLPQHLIDKTLGLYKAGKLEVNYQTMELNDVVRLSEQLLYTKKWQDIFEISLRGEATAESYKALLDLNKLDQFYGVLTDATSTVNLGSLGLEGYPFANNEKLALVSTQGKKYLLDGWYNGAYEIMNPPANQILAMHVEQFVLPQENPYVPADFKMYSSLEPQKSVEGLNGEILLNPGAGQSLPKASLTVLLMSPGLAKNDKAQMGRYIFLKNWLLANVREVAYPLEDAGYVATMGVQPTLGALMISMEGWSDKFEKAASDFIKMIRFSEDEVAFQKFKNLQISLLQKASKTVDVAVSEAFYSSYYPSYPSRLDQIAAIQDIKLSELKTMYDELMKQFYVKGVFSGNIKAGQAQTIMYAFGQKWPQTQTLTESQIAEIKVPMVSHAAKAISVEVDLGNQANSRVSQYFQFGYNSKKERVMAAILGAWVGQPFFDELRTKQLVSYTPQAYFSIRGDSYGINFDVSSGTHGAEDISQRMTAFIIDWTLNVLPKTKQSEVDEIIQRFKSNEEALKSQPKNHDQFSDDNLFKGPTEYGDETEQYNITIEELVEFASEKLVQSPEGVLVKIRSVNDGPAKDPSAPALGLGAAN